MNTEESVSDSETAAEETDAADTEQDAAQEPRHRPAEKRLGTSPSTTRSKACSRCDWQYESTEAEGVQSASAAALAAVDSDNGSDTNDEEALFATIPSAQTTDAPSTESGGAC